MNLRRLCIILYDCLDDCCFYKNKCCVDYKVCCGRLDYLVIRVGKFVYGSCLVSLKYLFVLMRVNILELCLRVF